jgi:AcrR family transcriptional regulator
VSNPAPGPIERRTADATRTLVIAAARALFARYPYPEVTVKRIADEAGVSAPLVMKYFDSKDNLLEAATDFSTVLDDLLDAPLRSLAEHMVTGLMRAHDSGIDPLLAFLYIAGRRDAPDRGRNALQDQFIDKLRTRLRGPDARLRAELCCAELIGVSALRRLFPASKLATIADEDLIRLLVARIAPLVDGSVPIRPRSPVRSPG